MRTVVLALALLLATPPSHAELLPRCDGADVREVIDMLAKKHIAKQMYLQRFGLIDPATISPQLVGWSLGDVVQNETLSPDKREAAAQAQAIAAGLQTSLTTIRILARRLQLQTTSCAADLNLRASRPCGTMSQRDQDRPTQGADRSPSAQFLAKHQCVEVVPVTYEATYTLDHQVYVEVSGIERRWKF